MSSQRTMEDLTQLSDEDETQMSSEVSQALYEDDERQVFGVCNKIDKMSEQESELSETEGQQNQSEQEDKNTISEDEIPIQSQQSEQTWRGKNSNELSIKHRNLSKTEEPYESEKESNDVEMIEQFV